LPYLTCLGPYSVGKAILQKAFARKEIDGDDVPSRFPGLGVSGSLGRILTSYVLRVLLFVALVFFSAIFFQEAFFSAIELPDFATPILIAGAGIMFLLYDYILGCILQISKRYKF
ncbi:MAG: hypothetical protein LBU41_04890, partial [Clostridiales Family XIII bacterium]|nr:hypothetical protein [Clostridiales Family XIII bacterium]